MTRDAQVARVLWVILGLNLIVAAAKLLIGHSIGALALVADGMHSVFDGTANVVGLVGISLASRPPDRNHPYGHRRFETLAALGIGILIGAGFLELLQQVVTSALTPGAQPQVSWAAALVVAGTIVVNLFISRYESGKARQLGSAILEADSRHTLSDAAASLAVLAGFGGVALGYPQADLVAATIVAWFIARTAWSVLRNNIAILSDEAQLDPLEVHRIVTGVPGVRGAHLIRSRGALDAVQLDLHVQVSPNTSITEAHGLTHAAIDALKAHFPSLKDVIIHTEPATGHEHEMTRLIP